MLDLSGPDRTPARIQIGSAHQHLIARDLESSEWNVPHRGKNFRRTDRWPGWKFLPVQWRVFAHNFVEARCQRQNCIVQATAGEIRPGSESVFQYRNAGDRGYRVPPVTVSGSV